MPGFSIQNANPSQSKFNKAEFRRKHRWRVTNHAGSGLKPQDWLYLQKASRPAFKFNEAVVHHDQEQAYFAGKQEWEPITLTFYDVEASDPATGGTGGVNDISRLIFAWIGDGTNPGSVGELPNATMHVPSAYKLDLLLELTRADGSAGEQWTLYGCWPLSANWQDLNYEDTTIQLIEVVVRFDRAARTDGPVV